MPETEVELLEEQQKLLLDLVAQQKDATAKPLGFQEPSGFGGQPNPPLTPPESGDIAPGSPFGVTQQRDTGLFRTADEPKPEIAKAIGRFIFEAPNGANLIDDPAGYLVGMTVLAPGPEESAKRVLGGAVSGATFGQITPFADEELEDGKLRKETGSFKTGAVIGTLAPITALSKLAGGALRSIGLLKGVPIPASVAKTIEQTIEAGLVGSAYAGIEGAAKGEGVDAEEVLITGGIFGSIPIVGKGAVRLLRFMPQRIQKFIAGLFGSPTPKPVRDILGARRKEILLGKLDADEVRTLIKEKIPIEHRAEALRLLDPTAIGPPIGRTKSLKVTDKGLIPKSADPIRAKQQEILVKARADIAFTEEQLNVLRNARKKLTDLGDEYVNLGLLDRETYEANVSTYLGRFYKDTENNRSVFQTLKDFVIRGNRAKERTLATIEQRMKKGLVLDPSYSVSKSIENVTFDIATARAFQKIAQNREFTSAVEKSGFKAIPNEKKFGDLAGKWVDPLVFDEINVLINTRSDIGGIYDKLLGMWKFGKTAANPATHGRNIFSNTILADLGGLSPTRVDVYFNAARGYLNKSTEYKEALREGLFGTDWYGAEIKQFLGAAESGSGSMFSRAWDVAGKMSDMSIGKLGNLYQAEEHYFKFALYSHKRAQGLTSAEASRQAVKYLFDYSDVSPLLARLRRAPYGGPFVTFTAKALPLIAESAVNNPFSVGKYLVAAKGITAYSQTKLGMSDAEFALMKETLPPYQRGGWQVPMPFTDKDGNPVLFDLTYNLPWGDLGEQGVFSDEILDFANVKQGSLLRKVAEPALSIAEKFVGSNPAVRVPAGILFNRDPFSGREIVSETDRSLELAGANTRAFALKQFSPSIINNLSNVIDAAMEKRLPSGEKRDLIFSTLQYLVGLKFRPVLLDKNERITRARAFKKVDELVRRAWLMGFDKSLTSEEVEQQKNDILKAIQRVKDDLSALYVEEPETELEGATE